MKTFDELSVFIDRFDVQTCLINPQPEPHLVQAWIDHARDRIYKVHYTNDGLRQPRWDDEAMVVTVDRTFALNSAYEEIRAGDWWLPKDAMDIDGGEFYAQLKAPTRVRDMTTGELRYVWQETSGLDHYRHAHAYDHLAGVEYVVLRMSVII